MGFEEVSTFRASGNVIFATPKREAETRLAARVEAELGERLGYEVPVFLRSDSEIEAVAAQEPFDPEAVESSKGKLQVSFLKKKPSAAAKKNVMALATPPELSATIA